MLTFAALVTRMRQLGGVAGEITTTASDRALARFVRQTTVLLTSYRRDESTVAAPVSIAVDGIHAFVCSPGTGGKIKRIRRNPTVESAPCTALGKPTGPAVRMQARFLSGEEFRRAGWLLALKYPMLYGVSVPVDPPRRPSEVRRTVYLELTPTTQLTQATQAASRDSTCPAAPIRTDPGFDASDYAAPSAVITLATATPT